MCSWSELGRAWVLGSTGGSRLSANGFVGAPLTVMRVMALRFPSRPRVSGSTPRAVCANPAVGPGATGRRRDGQWCRGRLRSVDGRDRVGHGRADAGVKRPLEHGGDPGGGLVALRAGPPGDPIGEGNAAVGADGQGVVSETVRAVDIAAGVADVVARGRGDVKDGLCDLEEDAPGAVLVEVDDRAVDDRGDRSLSEDGVAGGGRESDRVGGPGPGVEQVDAEVAARWGSRRSWAARSVKRVDLSVPDAPMNARCWLRS